MRRRQLPQRRRPRCAGHVGRARPRRRQRRKQRPSTPSAWPPKPSSRLRLCTRSHSALVPCYLCHIVCVTRKLRAGNGSPVLCRAVPGVSAPALLCCTASSALSLCIPPHRGKSGQKRDGGSLKDCINAGRCSRMWWSPRTQSSAALRRCTGHAALDSRARPSCARTSAWAAPGAASPCPCSSQSPALT